MKLEEPFKFICCIWMRFLVSDVVCSCLKTSHLSHLILYDFSILWNEYNNFKYDSNFLFLKNKTV